MVLTGCAVQVFWLLLGSRFGRRPNPTPDSNPNPNPKPQPKRQNGPKLAINSALKFAKNQEISQLRTTLPKCRPPYPFFKSKTSLKIPFPRLLNLLKKMSKLLEKSSPIRMTLLRMITEAHLHRHIYIYFTQNKQKVRSAHTRICYKDYPGRGNRSVFHPYSSLGNTFTHGVVGRTRTCA